MWNQEFRNRLLEANASLEARLEGRDEPLRLMHAPISGTSSLPLSAVAISTTVNVRFLVHATHQS